VIADPKPEVGINFQYCQSTIALSNSDGPYITDFLETQRRMSWIVSPKAIGRSGSQFDVGRKFRVIRPKIRSRQGSHLVAASSFGYIASRAIHDGA